MINFVVGLPRLGALFCILQRVLPFGAVLVASACRDAPGEAPEAQRAGEGEAGAPPGVEPPRVKADTDPLNPRGLEVYAGPVGSLRGTVKVTGDAPPLMADMLAKLPSEGCGRAHEMQRRLFRKGPRGTLADVLVAVTKYQGFVPASSEAVRVDMRDCAFSSRTVALTFGQRMDVYNHDATAYMPKLVGAPSQVLRVAVQGKSPVPLFVANPGRYALVEQSRPYMAADVFVVLFPTFDVTGLDGEFSVAGIPVGEVKVNAYSPSMDQTVERSVTVREGQTTRVDFELAFSKSKFDAAQKSKQEKTQNSAPSP